MPGAKIPAPSPVSIALFFHDSRLGISRHALSAPNGRAALYFEDLFGLWHQIFERVLLPAVKQAELAGSGQWRPDPRLPVDQAEFAIDLRDLFPCFQL